MISIAIIPDGNRRYSQKMKIPLYKAYAKACLKVEELLDWSLESKKINEVTVWGLSTENFKRNQSELALLNALYRENLEKLINNPKIHDNKVNVRIVGNKKLLDESVSSLVEKAENATKDYENFTLNIALAYGGREEIINAANQAIENSEKITEKNIQKYLYVPRNPDLLIRTSGVQRLSGYLSWQSAYSELYFSDLLWPEFSKQEFDKAIEAFEKTKRNFGK